MMAEVCSRMSIRILIIALNLSFHFRKHEREIKCFIKLYADIQFSISLLLWIHESETSAILQGCIPLGWFH